MWIAFIIGILIYLKMIKELVIFPYLYFKYIQIKAAEFLMLSSCDIDLSQCLILLENLTLGFTY